MREISNVMTAIKQGIVTSTTKETLLKLEQDKEETEINIAKERIERPVLSKEQIKYWITKFAKTNLDDSEQKRRLIDVFLNSVYIYDDKTLIILNYKDGEICVDFGEISDVVNKKGNPDDSKNHQSSPKLACGDPDGTRTRVAAVKGRSLNRLTTGPSCAQSAQYKTGIAGFGSGNWT